MYFVQTTHHFARFKVIVIFLGVFGFALPLAAIAEDPSEAASSVLDRVRQHTFHPQENGYTTDAQLERHGIADFDDKDWLVRTLAIRDLARIGTQATHELLSALDDDNLHVRHIAALTLGILPVEDAGLEIMGSRLQRLQLRLLNDPEPIVRSEAAIALGRIGHSIALDALKQAAEDDSNRDVRHQCALAIDRIEKGIPWDDSIYEAYRAMDESTFNSVAVGEPALDFTLLDTDGNPWQLSDYLGEKTIVLIWIFADWCPVCHGEFRDLVQMKEAYQENDVVVATVECNELYRTRVMAGQELMPEYWFAEQAPQAGYDARWWPHLSDPAGKIGAKYGVSPLTFAVHAEYINRPATIIIDKEGIVRLAYYGTFWGDRPSIEEVFEMILNEEYDFEHPRKLSLNP